MPARPFFLILGPVALRDSSRSPAVAGDHVRRLLLALLLDANHAVPIRRLTDCVWGADQPHSAARTLQSMVSRLRHALAGFAEIRSIDHSYMLVTEPGRIDAVVFERLVNEADRSITAGNPEEALRLLRRALGLWRGAPFGDLATEEFAQLETLRLEDLRGWAMELTYEAEVAAGLLGEAISKLEAAVEARPYRERLWWLLGRALAEDGRRVDALRALESSRHILGEVGIEPGSELIELEELIYAGATDRIIALVPPERAGR